MDVKLYSAGFKPQWQKTLKNQLHRSNGWTTWYKRQTLPDYEFLVLKCINSQSRKFMTKLLNACCKPLLCLAVVLGCIPKLVLSTHLFTRSPAAAKIADRTGYQWPSRSSKVDDFHLIWKSICNFLLVINSNLGPISHRFRDMTSFP